MAHPIEDTGTRTAVRYVCAVGTRTQRSCGDTRHSERPRTDRSREARCAPVGVCSRRRCRRSHGPRRCAPRGLRPRGSRSALAPSLHQGPVGRWASAFIENSVCSLRHATRAACRPPLAHGSLLAGRASPLASVASLQSATQAPFASRRSTLTVPCGHRSLSWPPCGRPRRSRLATLATDHSGPAGALRIARARSGLK